MQEISLVFFLQTLFFPSIRELFCKQSEEQSPASAMKGRKIFAEGGMMENSKEEEQMACFRRGRNSRNMRNLSEPRPERLSLGETAFSFFVTARKEKALTLLHVRA